MPVNYEYKCACEHTTIIRVDVDERDNQGCCDECEQPYQRVYSAPGISFKGTGWAGKSSLSNEGRIV
jgi:putative FmdB family regulatory protein